MDGHGVDGLMLREPEWREVPQATVGAFETDTQTTIGLWVCQRNPYIAIEQAQAIVVARDYDGATWVPGLTEGDEPAGLEKSFDGLIERFCSGWTVP
jgi:hypothetical protein